MLHTHVESWHLNLSNTTCLIGNFHKKFQRQKKMDLGVVGFEGNEKLYSSPQF
jgi:hypothetical protein